MELGGLIDQLYAMREQRLKLQREVDDLKREENNVKEQVRLELENTGLAKASGKLATASQTFTVTPHIVDWEEVYKFVKHMDRFDLLHRRISAPAWRDLLQEGILVNGTEAVEVWDLSLTKSTR
jgi:regulator of replication initiation timing